MTLLCESSLQRPPLNPIQSIGPRCRPWSRAAPSCQSSRLASLDHLFLTRVSFTAGTGEFQFQPSDSFSTGNPASFFPCPLLLPLLFFPVPYLPSISPNMEGINHGGHGAARPQNAGLPFFGIDDAHMIPDDFSFDSPFSPTDSNKSNTNDSLLQDPIFPEWKTGAPRGGDNPDDLQKQDPLAAQIWRLYTRTKSQLPNQERMENLTWRMMAMSLKRKEREQLALAQQARYALSLSLSPSPQLHIPLSFNPFIPSLPFPPSPQRNPTKKDLGGTLLTWPAGPHKRAPKTIAPLRVASRSCVCQITPKTKATIRTTNNIRWIWIPPQTP